MGAKVFTLNAAKQNKASVSMLQVPLIDKNTTAKIVAIVKKMPTEVAFLNNKKL